MEGIPEMVNEIQVEGTFPIKNDRQSMPIWRPIKLRYILLRFCELVQAFTIGPYQIMFVMISFLRAECDQFSVR